MHPLSKQSLRYAFISTVSTMALLMGSANAGYKEDLEAALDGDAIIGGNLSRIHSFLEKAVPEITKNMNENAAGYVESREPASHAHLKRLFTTTQKEAKALSETLPQVVRSTMGLVFEEAHPIYHTRIGRLGSAHLTSGWRIKLEEHTKKSTSYTEKAAATAVRIGEKEAARAELSKRLNAARSAHETLSSDKESRFEKERAARIASYEEGAASAKAEHDKLISNKAAEYNKRLKEIDEAHNAALENIEKRKNEAVATYDEALQRMREAIGSTEHSERDLKASLAPIEKKKVDAIAAAKKTLQKLQEKYLRERDGLAVRFQKAQQGRKASFERRQEKQLTEHKEWLEQSAAAHAEEMESLQGQQTKEISPLEEGLRKLEATIENEKAKQALYEQRAKSWLAYYKESPLSEYFGKSPGYMGDGYFWADFGDTRPNLYVPTSSPTAADTAPGGDEAAGDAAEDATATTDSAEEAAVSTEHIVIEEQKPVLASNCTAASCQFPANSLHHFWIPGDDATTEALQKRLFTEDERAALRGIKEYMSALQGLVKYELPPAGSAHPTALVRRAFNESAAPAVHHLGMAEFLGDTAAGGASGGSEADQEVRHRVDSGFGIWHLAERLALARTEQEAAEKNSALDRKNAERARREREEAQAKVARLGRELAAEKGARLTTTSADLYARKAAERKRDATVSSLKRELERAEAARLETERRAAEEVAALERQHKREVVTARVEAGRAKQALEEAQRENAELARQHHRAHQDYAQMEETAARFGEEAARVRREITSLRASRLAQEQEIQAREARIAELSKKAGNAARVAALQRELNAKETALEMTQKRLKEQTENAKRAGAAAAKARAAAEARLKAVRKKKMKGHGTQKRWRAKKKA